MHWLSLGLNRPLIRPDHKGEQCVAPLALVMNTRHLDLLPRPGIQKGNPRAISNGSCPASY